MAASYVIGDPRISEKFWKRVTLVDSGCWQWTAGCTGDGYSAYYPCGVRVSGVQYQVRGHRHSYEVLVGPIPDGMVMDHLCKNPKCVNPGHLEPVTQRINCLRGSG